MNKGDVRMNELKTFEELFPILNEELNTALPEPDSDTYFDNWCEAVKKYCLSKQRVREILDEEVSKPESHKGMVGWTIPSFHSAIDSINIPQSMKELIKSQCATILHKEGLKVDVADYHDRILKRLNLDDI